MKLSEISKQFTYHDKFNLTDKLFYRMKSRLPDLTIQHFLGHQDHSNKEIHEHRLCIERKQKLRFPSLQVHWDCKYLM